MTMECLGRSAGLSLSRAGLPVSRWSRDQRLAWLLWASCPGVGWTRLRALEAQFGSLLAAWEAPPEAFSALPGLGPAFLAQLQRFRGRWGPEPLPAFSAAIAAGRGVLVPGDPPYPQAVAGLERPAVALHWRGRGALWPLLARRRAVAVVGTRRPSRHGLAMAEAVGAALAVAGWPVVSGLAEGIDAAAHRGCLERQGVPVGVLGTPLDRVYPRHHTQLQGLVGEAGLLVSEQAPGAAVQRGHFAARNRLLVALVGAVVVVECPERSGALHSAELAWRQQLPLWVVPADAQRLSARGSNRLLQQGASALLDPADLIHQLGPGPRMVRAVAPPADLGVAGTPEAAGLLAALNPGASLEQLCRLTGHSPSQLAAPLLALELAGLVRAEPGLHWRRL